MAQMMISVPDSLEDWAKQRVAEGDFVNTSAYVRDLMQRDLDAAAGLAWLQAEVAKVFASGIDPRPVHQIFADIRAKHLPRNA